MPTFFVTFGAKSPFRYGWAEIIADDHDTAFAEAHRVFGPGGWASLYEGDSFDRRYYPDGKLGRTIKLPPGYRHRSV